MEGFSRGKELASVLGKGLGAVGHVPVRVLPAVLVAPGAEASLAAPAGQREAAREVTKHLPAVGARAAVVEQVLLDVLAVAVDHSLSTEHTNTGTHTHTHIETNQTNQKC